MFGLFKKKKADYNIYAPVDGKSIALDSVEDQVFASKMLGDGIAFQLDGNKSVLHAMERSQRLQIQNMHLVSKWKMEWKCLFM